MSSRVGSRFSAMKIALLVICTVISVVKYAGCAKILGVWVLPGKSHFILGNNLMKGLAEAGHDVTLISPFEDKVPPRRGSYRNVVVGESVALFESMTFFGLDISCPVVQSIAVVLVVGAITLISLLKFYAYISCGYFHDKVNMEGKTVIITGANGGIGKETAREIAQRGARVIMACRNLVAAKAARDEIANITKNENVVVKRLDLSSQKSVREFAEDINRSESRLDVLLHNAGTAEKNFRKTEDGIEMTMATNHFGAFLLTHLLIDLLKRSQPARVVVVASELYRLTSLNLNNINPVSSWFPPWIYYPSKYANICFTLELARRLEGTGVTANCLHPGMIDSGIWRNVPVPLNYPTQFIAKCFFKTPLQGCQTSVFLACSDKVKGVTGKYFMDCSERGLSRGVSDPAKAKKLWELSEKLVNLRSTDSKI